MNSRKTLFLLDAFALIYRAYYAFINNPRITTTGINTSATFGFCTFLSEILEEHKPTHIAVIFDPDGPTFRHKMYKPYKAQRPPMPEDLKKSIPYIKHIIEAMGIRHLDVPGYEADDVIGTLAKNAEKEGFSVYMITPDKDYAQLVSNNITMYKPGRSGNLAETWGIPEILDRFGIERVDQVIDILGLMGDTADNVPGCAGIGPKTASSLVYKYGDIEGIYEHIDEIKGKQKENLINCKETVLLSKQLVTICTQVPTGISSEDLRRKEVDMEELRPILEELEIFSLINRLASSGKRLEDSEDLKHEEDLDLKIIECDDSASTLENIRKNVKEFSLSFGITENMNLFSDYPSDLTLCTDKNTVFYIPLCNKRNIEALKKLFGSRDKTWISASAKRDLIILKHMGIIPVCRIFDITVAHYILQPEMNHSLKRIALELLHYQITEEKKAPSVQLSLFEEGNSQNRQDMAEECSLVVRLKPILEERLLKNGQDKLFNEVEIPLISVLADMEYEGVSIDKDALDKLDSEFTGMVSALEQEIYREAGHEFNINSPKQLSEVLFGELKIDPMQKKTKNSGQYSTSEQILSKQEDKYPIIHNILEYRGIKKLMSTYTEALPQFINPADNKIHTNFNQTETATGRLSSLNPNLQNIPIRSEEGRRIRMAFVSGRTDFCFFSADYSQVELRLMASLSKTKELIDAFKHGEDIHAATAAKIYKVPLEEVTSEMRRRAKTANFGIIYGISAWGLAERLKISRKEGKELIEGYFNLYPGVKEYMEKSIELARSKKYVETISGRRRYLNDINSHNAVVRSIAERNAINTPIQGSAADIIKMAMIRIDHEIKQRGLRSRMILQVHDELNFICHNDEKDELESIVRENMEHVVELDVPLTVSCGFGNNWFEAH